MNKRFFSKKIKIPFRKAKWGIVEVEKEGEFYRNPCVIAEKGLCYDIAMKIFLVEKDNVKIYPARKKRALDKDSVFVSRDGNLTLLIEKDYFNYFKNLYVHNFKPCENYMSKLFFIRKLKIPFWKAKWGIVEVEKEGEFFRNPCIIAEKGLCYDIAMKRFMVEKDNVKIYPARKRKTGDKEWADELISRDGSLRLEVQGGYRNLYAPRRLPVYQKNLKSLLEQIPFEEMVASQSFWNVEYRSEIVARLLPVYHKDLKRQLDSLSFEEMIEI